MPKEKKTKDLFCRIEPSLHNSLEQLATTTGSISNAISFLANFYKENSAKETTEFADELIDSISNTIEYLQNKEEYAIISQQETQFLKSLNFCYDLLVRNEIYIKNTDNYAPDPDPECAGETRYIHALSTNKIADELIYSFKNVE